MAVRLASEDFAGSSAFQNLTAKQSAGSNSGMRLEFYRHLRFAASEAARDSIFCVEEVTGHIVSKVLRSDDFVVNANIESAASLLSAPIAAVQAHRLVGKDFHHIGD